MKKIPLKEQQKCDAYVNYLIKQMDGDINPCLNTLVKMTNKVCDIYPHFIRSGGNKQYWHFVGDVWEENEFPHVTREYWKAIFSNPNAPQIMSIREKNLYKLLPDEFKVYRGGITSQGFSWTLDKGVAEFFCSRSKMFSEYVEEMPSHVSEVFEMTVNKSNCVAFKDGCKEQEIIVKYWELN